MKQISEFEFEFRQPVIDACKFHVDFYAPSLHERYGRREQRDKDKVEYDMLIGKIGEVTIYKYLRTKFNSSDIIPPYLYNGKNPKNDDDFSHDPDVIVTNPKINIHIKTQEYSSSIIFGKGWVFEKNAIEKSRKENLKNDYICFGVVDMFLKTYKIHVLQKYSLLFKEENMFSEMDLKHLKSKTVIKLKTFNEKNIEKIIEIK